MKNIKLISNDVRKMVVRMINKGKSSHIASVLSCVDILTVLYFKVMKVNPQKPKWAHRDRFILSKGHAGAGIYATLSKRGFFNERVLNQHYQNGSKLSGHVSHKGIKGVEFSTGSLGHGLPVACGYALALKNQKKKSKVFCLMSDGELNEGSNWEAFLFANHHKLNNLIAIIDRNRLQSIYDTEKTLKLEPLSEKIRSFGWNVKLCDGHNHKKLSTLLIKKYNSPMCLIANTVKGKGVSFMENNNLWHYKTPENDFFYKAISELNKI